MMRTIYKYPVPIVDSFALSLPRGARLLDVQMHNGRAVLWAAVVTEQPLESRTFVVIGTGSQVHQSWKLLTHVSTFQQEGDFVWHLFEFTGE